MKNRSFKLYYLFSVVGVFIISFYPLYMGIKVVVDMLINGTVMKENYPKYIIPYTPICVALIVGILLLPILIKLCKKLALLASAVISSGIFFGIELLLENKVVVTAAEKTVQLEDWQMYMCYIPPEWSEPVTSYKELTPVEILMGDYNPAFKLHFYLISVIIIIAVLNVIYGFAHVILSGEKKRLKVLVLQSVSTAIFVSLCILACFTAFWRDGFIVVSTISAVLMTLFFIIFGMVGGIFTGSFVIGKRPIISAAIPAVSASALTTLMYIGEMALLHGNLYILGKGFFFKNLPYIILSPFDILVILASGAFTAVIFILLNKKGGKINENRED